MCIRDRNYLDYEPNPTPHELMGSAIYVAHNSYLQIWAECGTIAFAIYLLLIFTSFWTLWGVRRRAKQLYFSSWIIYYANAFEASLLGFMVGSTFLNRAHFDLFYHFVALILAFAAIAKREMDQGIEAPVPKNKKRGRGTIRPVRTPGFGSRPPTRGFRNTPLLPESA